MSVSSLAVQVVPSAARTTNGQGSGFGSKLSADPYVSSVALNVNVTAISGTPSMTLSVQWSNDGQNWSDADTADTFSAITGVKNVVKAFPIKGQMFRVIWTITGTSPSLTFSVTAVNV